jgi:hypothetical protein
VSRWPWCVVVSFLPFLSLRFLSGGRTWEAVVVTAAEAGGPGGRSLGFCREREREEIAVIG